MTRKLIRADENASSTSLGTDAHCAMLTEQIRDRNMHVMEGFKLFVQMFSAIVAGAVTLRLQYGEADASRFVLLSDALVALVAVASAVVIGDNYRAWRGYRRRLSEIAGVGQDGKPVIEQPKMFPSFRIEATMLFSIAVATVGFWVFNPLAL